MKTNHDFHLSGVKISRFFRARGWPIAVSLVFVASMAGQLSTSPDDKAAPTPKQEPLLAKVMTDLPHYGESPTPTSAADAKPILEVTTETVHFAPFVVIGDKRIKLLGPELFTKKAFAAEVFKRYDYSAFSSFQHKEDVRLEDMDELKNYTDNLMRAGDEEEGRAIKKESSRLFLRTRDPESEYVVSIFNPRIR